MRFIRAAVITVPLLLAIGVIADAQFKELGPAPFPPTVAHQKIRKLLDTVDAENRKQTIATLSGLTAWYRDILDEELIASWKGTRRANLIPVIEELADTRVASGVVAFSWRERSPATFNPTYAPLLAHLMARYAKSAEPFLADLLTSPPDLSQPEAETVCRILLEMPDISTWKENTLRILPKYRAVAENVLLQELHGNDQEKSTSAKFWLSDLKWDEPAGPTKRPDRRRTLSMNTEPESTPPSQRLHVDGPPAPAETAAPPVHAAAPRVPTPITRASITPAPAPAPAITAEHQGPRSGTFESSGGPIPQNSEYVFRNVPLVKLKLDYDSKIWEARLVPGDGNTQRLLVRNKSGGPQKRCIVHWNVIP